MSGLYQPISSQLFAGFVSPFIFLTSIEMIREFEYIILIYQQPAGSAVKGIIFLTK